MFSQLKQGSQIYILHENASTPFVEVGVIETINSMMPMVYYPNLPTVPIDMVAKVGERSVPLQRIPPNTESATVVAKDGESIIIACSKEAINNEVEVMRRKSLDILGSVEYHKGRLLACDNLVKQLNPELVEKAQQQEEIATLKSQISTLTNLIEELRSERTSSDKGNKSK